MARTAKDKEGGGFSALASRLLDLLGTAGLLASEARRALSQRAERALWRLVLLLHLTLWISAGLFLLLLGGLQLLIDQGGLPRGAVYAGGGLLTLLCAALAFVSLRAHKRAT